MAQIWKSIAYIGVIQAQRHIIVGRRICQK